jgi:hypothetical protein
LGIPISPDDDRDGTRSFRARFNQLVDILLVESSVKLVARTAADVADLYEGTGVWLGDPRMARKTGLSERTVQTAWAVLRTLEMAERVSTSYVINGKRRADEYNLCIPPDWRSLPVLGPAEGRFRCIECGKVFNPRAHSIYNPRTGGVSWRVAELCFCSMRRRKGKPPSCSDTWNAAHRAGGLPWGKDTGEPWSLFRQARGDDWPEPQAQAA